ncbi:MAG: hypothetical protein ACJ77G_11250 [Solirubrobacteraceae bacterium]
MASPERVDERSRGRLSHAWSGTRQFVRLGYRDPEHVTERMALYAAEHLAEHSREWAEAKAAANPDTPRVKIADDLRTQSAQAARIDGAVAGTPFLVALVPGYVAYLWQEGRMGLRTAALYGREPSDPRTTAEMLALRGVHPTPDQAAAALEEVRDAPPPPKPTTRRPLRVWVRSVKALLIFGGFLDPPTEERIEVAHPRLKAAAGIGIGVAVWLITWVLPLTFMIAMAWACESHTRQLGRRILLFYDGQADSAREAIKAADRRTDKGHDRRRVLRAVAVFLSIAIPLGFIAVADHYRQSTGINGLGALGALVALSLVVAIAVVTSRR